MLKAFENLAIWKKVLLGYILLIVFPFVIFAIVFSNNYFHQMYDRYLTDEQWGLEQGHSHLSNRFAQIQGNDLMFQNDKALNNYLSGAYNSVSDEMYYYLTEIHPLFSSVLAANKDIDGIDVYCLSKPLTPLPESLIYTGGSSEVLDNIPISGEWSFVQNTDSPVQLRYQIPLYTPDYYKRVGYLEITVNNSVLNYLKSPDEFGHRFLYMNENWWSLDGKELVPAAQLESEYRYLQEWLAIADDHQGETSYRSEKLLVNTMHIYDPDAVVVSITPQIALGGARTFCVPMMLMAGAFALLSGVYTVILASFTQRLHHFARYIAQTDYNFLEEYPAKPSHDEIGSVVTAYNQMILRIQTLVSDLNIAELKRKEADLSALQSQMRPHFIYNSLETARMIAEINRDEEASGFLYNLGQFIRYSFSYATSEVLLTKELEIVGKYLEIYKTSMGDRLDYSISIEGEITDVRCPPFMVQPLVENSLHHGINSYNPRLHIDVHVQRLDDTMILTVEDNGIGISPAQLNVINSVLTGESNPETSPKKGTGLGIGNTLTRIQNFYGDNAVFTVESTLSHGTKCKILIKHIGNLKAGETNDDHPCYR
ncbi:MAG: sensor histidine kinase [Acetanaerobacterium sp.]